MQFFDRLSNLISGLGTTKDKTQAAFFTGSPLDLQQIVSAYRWDWIARKVVDIPAFDMVRAGRNWQADDADIEKLEAGERRIQLKPKLARAKRLARLTGGSAIILGVDQGQPQEPLDIERLKAGALKYIHVVHRYEMTTGQIDRDPMSPFFGEPKSYQLNGINGPTVDIHPSRVIRFLGNEIPDLMGTLNDGWGDSVLEVLNDAVINAGLTTSGIAHLVQEAKIDVFKMPGLTANVGSADYRERILERFRLANTAKSTVQALIMDAEEEYEQKSINFTQLPDIARLYLSIAAGAADIPATRFLSQSPAGQNATGESDVRNYYDRLGAEQELDLRPPLERLDEVLIRSELGKRPPEIHFAFAPLWQLSETERSTIRKQDAETAKVYVDSGLVPLPALAEAVQNSLVEQGTYPGLETALAETMAKVGLSTEMFKALVAAWQAGGAPKSVLFERLSQAGLLPAGMTQDTYTAEIEEEGGGLGMVGPAADPSANGLPPGANPAAGATGKPPLKVAANDAEPRTLYVSRRLANAADFIAWAKEQGFVSTLPPEDLHVTITYSRQAVDWMAMGENWSGDGKGNITIAAGGPRLVEALGDKGAVVLLFASNELDWRHNTMIERGATYPFGEFQPHITITYAGKGVDLSKVEPYRGPLVFGPERFEELNEDWSAQVVEA